MSDATFIADCGKVTTPEAALKIIVDNEDLFGFDPYYKDLREAMLNMAERVLQKELSS